MERRVDIGRRVGRDERQVAFVREVQLVSMVFQNKSELGDLKTLPLSQRQFFPQELEALLHYNGFAIEHLWGDFTRGPLEDDSESQVLVVRKR